MKAIQTLLIHALHFYYRTLLTLVMVSATNAFYVNAFGQCAWCDGNRVSIGANFVPQAVLHVDSTARIGRAGNSTGELTFTNVAGHDFTIAAPDSMATQKYLLPISFPTSATDQLICNTDGQMSWAASGTINNAWLTTGNNGTSTASNFLGTLDNVDFAIRTNNTEKIRVQTDGNVGIGTTSPIGILHLDNAADSSHTELVIERSGNGAEANLRFNVNSNQRARIGLPTDASDNDLYYDVLQNNKDHIFRVNFSGNTDYEVMRIEGQYANVGVGEPSPAAKLHVMCEPDESGPAIISRFGIRGIDAPMFLQIANQEFSSSLFAPIVQGTTNGTSKPGFMFRGMLENDVNDTGTEPVVEFQARKNDSDSSNVRIRVRPLFEFTNNDKELITVLSANSGNAGRTGIGTTTPSGTLDVNGTVYIDYSSLEGGDFMTDTRLGINSTTGQLMDLGTSSIQMKENVEDIEFDKEAFLNLRPVDFTWKEFYGGNMDVGLIAEEVNQAFPALTMFSHKFTYLPNGDVVRDSLGIAVVDTTELQVRGVRYHKLPVYLLALAKDQQNEIDELRSQLEALTAIVQNCCAPEPSYRIEDGDELNGIDSEQKDIEEYVLLQNDPNPFNDYTDIKYNASECGQCEIVVIDSQGRIVKRIRVAGSSGKVRIYSSEIGSGIFIYSLLRNGTLIESAKMVSAKY